MIYVGIDIAKLNHLASTISSEGEVLIGPFKFINYGDIFLRSLVASFFNVYMLTPSKCLQCERITFAKRKRTRLTHTSPGIGYINGGMILDEIGDIYRFLVSNKLLAFAGLDPSVHLVW